VSHDALRYPIILLDLFPDWPTPTKQNRLPHPSRFSKGGYHRLRFRVVLGVGMKWRC